MRNVLIVAISLLLTLGANAQPPEGPAKAGMTFGQAVTAKDALDMENFIERVSEEETSFKVRGVVSDVCTKEGCWLKMKTANGKIMVKMKDHAFLVPVDINGKEIIVEGKAKLKITSVKDLQHYAEDEGKSAEEIAAIKEPKREIVLNASGILVL